MEKGHSAINLILSSSTCSMVMSRTFCLPSATCPSPATLLNQFKSADSRIGSNRVKSAYSRTDYYYDRFACFFKAEYFRSNLLVKLWNYASLAKLLKKFQFLIFILYMIIWFPKSRLRNINCYTNNLLRSKFTCRISTARFEEHK